jgi:hypothetical protein
MATVPSASAFRALRTPRSRFKGRRNTTARRPSRRSWRCFSRSMAWNTWTGIWSDRQPEGRKRIAQGFIPGNEDTRPRESRQGRKNLACAPCFFRLCGARTLAGPWYPPLKRWAMIGRPCGTSRDHTHVDGVCGTAGEARRAKENSAGIHPWVAGTANPESPGRDERALRACYPCFAPAGCGVGNDDKKSRRGA